MTKSQRVFAGILAALMGAMVIVPTIATLVRADDDVTFVDAEDLDDGDDEDTTPAKQDFSQEKSKISQLSDKYKELQNQQNQIKNKINATKNEKEKKVAVMQQIGGQIDLTTEQIGVLSERIDLLEQNIAQKEEEMRQKQMEIDENYDLFKQRFRAMTKAPSGSTVGLVLGAQSFSDFVTRTEVTTRVAQHDQDMITDLTRQKQELAKIKAEIEDDMKSVEGDKAEMDEKKKELDGQLAQTKQQVHDIATMEQQYLANKEAIDAQMKKVQAEIDLIYAEIARKSTQQIYVGGAMGQPTPTLNQITSPYGSRFGGSDFHTGMDFSGAGAYGQTIVAANTGKVAFVNLAVTPGYGYGKYLIIDHGGGITTLYAHCSAINVQVGDVVTRGQKIAEVGSTGWSTGPHCHFEVRVNGKHTNPVSYLQG